VVSRRSAMLSPGKICSKAPVIEEKAASLRARRGLCALFSHFFARLLRDQAELFRRLHSSEPLN